MPKSAYLIALSLLILVGCKSTQDDEGSSVIPKGRVIYAPEPEISSVPSTLQIPGAIVYTNINVGTSANDGTGDSLRVAMQKINYLALSFSNNIATNSADGKLNRINDTATNLIVSSLLTATNIVGNVPNVVNVLAAPYSAAGDGETDDTAAIQAAIDSAEGEVFLGNYTFATDALTIGSNTKITGAGTIQPIDYASGIGGVLRVLGTNIVIDGLTLDANTNANRGIRIMAGSTNVTLRNITIRNVKQSVSESDQAAAIRIEDGTDDILIENPRLFNTDGDAVTIARGILISSPGGGTVAPRVRIVGGVIHGVTPTTDGDGIVVQDFTSGGPIEIVGTHFSGTMKRAVKIQSPNVHVDGITVDGSAITYSAVSIYAPNSSVSDSQMTNGNWTTAIEIGSTIVSATNVIVTGNRFQMDPAFDISSTGDGIQVNGTNTSDIIITGNNFHRGRFGIRTQGYVHHSVYTPNTFREIGQTAIFFGASGGVSPSDIIVGSAIFQSVTNYGVRVSSGTNIHAANLVGDPLFGNDVALGVNCSLHQMTDDGWEATVSDQDDEFLFTIDGYSRVWMDKNGLQVQNTNTEPTAQSVFTALNDNTYFQLWMMSTNSSIFANRGYLAAGTNAAGITINTINAAGTIRMAVNAATKAEANTNGFLVYGNLTLSSNNAYAVGWNGSLKVPTEDAVYDEMETKSDVGHTHADATLTSIDWTKILNRPTGLDDGDDTGGSSANWVADGTTNSTLAGNASAHSLTLTNGASFGSGTHAVIAYALGGRITNAANNVSLTNSLPVLMSSNLTVNYTLTASNGVGSAAQVLKSGGAGNPPYWATDEEGAGGSDSAAIHDNVSGEISIITEKAVPVLNDWAIIEDSAASDAKKAIRLGSLPVSNPMATALGGKQASNVYLDDLSDGTLSDSALPASMANKTFTGTLTVPDNTIALGAKTTGNYAAGDAEAGAALTGDSATGFFSSGTLESARLPSTQTEFEKVLVFAGGGSELVDGSNIDFPVKHGWTITGYEIIADQSGSVEFHLAIEEDPYNGGTPLLYDNPASGGSDVDASAPPSLSSQLGKYSTTLTGWDTTWPAGSMVNVSVVSATTITHATLIIYYTK